MALAVSTTNTHSAGFSKRSLLIAAGAVGGTFVGLAKSCWDLWFLKDNLKKVRVKPNEIYQELGQREIQHHTSKNKKELATSIILSQQKEINLKHQVNSVTTQIKKLEQRIQDLTEQFQGLASARSNFLGKFSGRAYEIYNFLIEKESQTRSRVLQEKQTLTQLNERLVQLKQNLSNTSSTSQEQLEQLTQLGQEVRMVEKNIKQFDQTKTRINTALDKLEKDTKYLQNLADSRQAKFLHIAYHTALYAGAGSCLSTLAAYCYQLFAFNRQG